MQRKRGLDLGRPLGSHVFLDGSWVPAGALLAAHLAYGAYGVHSLQAALVIGVGTVVAYVLCVLAHAISHVIVARFLDSPLGVVRVFIFGEVPESDLDRRWSDHMMLALAGPITSAAIGCGAFIGSWYVVGDLAMALRVLGLANLALAVVNLIPALPLDGGRVLAAALFRRSGSFRHATRVAIVAGRWIGLLLAGVGIWLLSAGPDLLDATAFGSWLVLTGVFIVLYASVARPPMPRLPLAGATVGSWARPFAGRLEPDQPVPPSGGPFAVSSDRRLAGIVITPTTLGARAADVMVPWTSELNMSADAPLPQALERLAQRLEPLLVVVDDEGVVRGVLDEEAVRRHLRER